MSVNKPPITTRKMSDVLKRDLELDEFYEGLDGAMVRLTRASYDTSTVRYYAGADLVVQETSRRKGSDLSIAYGGDNLAQAILHRLRTIKGELSDTGHSSYGCEIYNLIGEPNTETTRQRLKLMVIEALRQEHRISEIVDVQVYSRQGGKMAIKSGGAESDAQLENARPKGNRPTNQDARSTQRKPSNEDLNSVDIDVFVRPVNTNQVIQIGMPFSLESIT